MVKFSGLTLFEFINYDKLPFPQQDHLDIFPFPRQVKHVRFPLDLALERDLKNVFHSQRDVEYYTDQVLNFLLFDRQYTHTESSGL